MNIVVASDHAGFLLKEVVTRYLRDAGHEVFDVGSHVPDPVDYPPFCAAAARAVVSGDAALAIVLGGSGQGEQIAANKVRGARAALCFNELTARLARQHNDANVLALGARVLGEGLALSVVDAFLSSEFDGGRHERRVGQIADIERDECEGPTL